MGWERGQRDGHFQRTREDHILKGQGWKDRGTAGHKDRGTEGWRDRQADRGAEAEGVGHSEALLQLCTAGSHHRRHSCTQLDPGGGGGGALPHLGTAGSHHRRHTPTQLGTGIASASGHGRVSAPPSHLRTAGPRGRCHIWAQLDPGGGKQRVVPTR